MPRWTLTPEQRFWSKVRKGDVCWNWTAMSDLPDSEKARPFRGFDVEGDIRFGLTHRMAFRRALRANGGRIW